MEPESATVENRRKSRATPRRSRGAKRLAVKKQLATAKSAEPEARRRRRSDRRRTVLPPLDVEVVAGDKHRKVHPGSNGSKCRDYDHPAPRPQTLPQPTDAAASQHMSADTQQQSYPLLAQQMNVQGSVVLQALIGADGVIQNLRVLSGPAILASAAQQAVREWRFKPVVQNGQAVETKAKITVNFTIKSRRQFRQDHSGGEPAPDRYPQSSAAKVIR